MEKMKYDATELAKMAIRNFQSATKECGTARPGVDPVSCVAGVFAAPIETLENVERELAEVRKENEARRFALESIIANNGDLAAASDAINAAMPGHPFLKN